MPGSELVQALSRGLEIIRMTARSENGLRTVEVADRLGVKPPTAHNLLRTLISEGFVEKTAEGLHKPGPAIYEICGESSRRDMILRAEEIMKNLRKDMPECVLTFSEPTASGMRVALRMSPDLPGVTQRPDNMNFNPYSTASGYLFFAFADENARARAESLMPFDEYGSHIWKSRKNFDSMIGSVRKERHAEKGAGGGRSTSLAVPLFDGRERFAGCLGASSTGAPLTKSVLKTLLDAAAKIVL